MTEFLFATPIIRRTLYCKAFNLLVSLVTCSAHGNRYYHVGGLTEFGISLALNIVVNPLNMTDLSSYASIW